MKRIAVLVGAVTLAAGSAWAVPVLTLDDGAGNSMTITDNGAGDLNADAGAILYSASFGVWSLNVEVGQTKPFLGTMLAPSMHLSSINTSTGAGDLTVTFSDDFFGPLPANYYFKAGAGGALGGGIGSTLSYNTYWSSGNAVPATTPLTTMTFSSASQLPVAFSGTDASGTVAGAYPYSLTQEIILSHAGGGSSSVDAVLNVVPEPTTLVLLGTGLVGLASVGRRRSRKV